MQTSVSASFRAEKREQPKHSNNSSWGEDDDLRHAAADALACFANPAQFLPNGSPDFEYGLRVALIPPR